MFWSVLNDELRHRMTLIIPFMFFSYLVSYIVQCGGSLTLIFFLFSDSDQFSFEGEVMLPLRGVIVEGSHIDGRLAALMNNVAGQRLTRWRYCL